MAAFDNVLSVLDKWPLWKRITATPEKVDELEERISALEEKLQDEWPPDVCKFCGKRSARLEHRTRANDKGIYREDWVCQECGQIEARSFKVR